VKSDCRRLNSGIEYYKIINTTNTTGHQILQNENNQINIFGEIWCLKVLVARISKLKLFIHRSRGEGELIL
jgi:hypothetical protein